MADTTIEWTDKVWNPVTGCTKVSQGCKNCYAERMFSRAYRHGAMIRPMGEDKPRWRKFTDVQCHPERLDQPLRWKKPRRIFVNSMSDLFHENVPDEFIEKVFWTMRNAEHHTFQILTKRPDRMLKFAQSTRVWLPFWPLRHVHLGVSCEDQATANERIPLLLQTPAAVRFVSAEPLLAPIKFNYDWLMGNDALAWIIVGGESGPGARPFDVAWAKDIIAQCKAAGVPCFVKQLGRHPITDHRTRPEGKEALWTRLLKDKKGGDWNEWPADLRVREFPK